METFSNRRGSRFVTRNGAPHASCVCQVATNRPIGGKHSIVKHSTKLYCRLMGHPQSRPQPIRQTEPTASRRAHCLRLRKLIVNLIASKDALRAAAQATRRRRFRELHSADPRVSGLNRSPESVGADQPALGAPVNAGDLIGGRTRVGTLIVTRERNTSWPAPSVNEISPSRHAATTPMMPTARTRHRGSPVLITTTSLTSSVLPILYVQHSTKFTSKLVSRGIFFEQRANEKTRRFARNSTRPRTSGCEHLATIPYRRGAPA
jgi:hypothetical protein